MHKIALAPTTLPNSPPLEYIDAAVRAGYDGIGIRLFRSPGITYAFHPVTGTATLMREVKSAISRAGAALMAPVGQRRFRFGVRHTGSTLEEGQCIARMAWLQSLPESPGRSTTLPGLEAQPAVLARCL